jgi:hypothetical protein
VLFVGLFLGARYSFRGPNVNNKVNDFMGKAQEKAASAVDMRGEKKDGPVYTDENGNGKKDKGDRFGIIGDNSYYYCIQEDFELSAYKKDENEIPYLDMDIEKVDAYVEKMRAMFAADSYLDVEEQYFATGNSAFVFCQVKDINNYYRDSEVKYGIFTYPKFDENQKDYRTLLHDQFTVLCVPTTVKGDELDMVSAVMEALASASYRTVRPAYYETTLRTKIAQDPQSAAMFDLIIDNIYIDAGIIYTIQLSTFHNYFREIIGSKENTVVSKYKSVTKQAERALNTMTNRFDRILSGKTGR